MEGRSLRPAAVGRERWPTRRPTPSRSTRSSSTAGRRSTPGAPTRYKLIEAPRPELYDLEADAGETQDRSARGGGPRVEAMRTRASAGDGHDHARRPRRRSTPRPPSGWRRSATSAAAPGGAAPGAHGPRPQGRHPPRHAAGPQRHVGRADRAGEGDPRAHRASRRGPGHARGPAHAGRRLRDRGPVRRRRSATCARSRSAGRSPPRTASCSATTCASPGTPQEAVAVLERTAARTRGSPSPGSRWPRSPSSRSGCGGRGRLREGPRARPRPRRGAARPGRPRAHRGRRRARPPALRARSWRLDPADAGALAKLGVVRMRTGRAGRRRSRSSAGGRARAEERRGAALPRGRPRLERPPGGGACPTSSGRSPPGQRTTMALNGLGLTRLELGDRAGAAAAFRESLAARSPPAGHRQGPRRSARRILTPSLIRTRVRGSRGFARLRRRRQVARLCTCG